MPLPRAALPGRGASGRIANVNAELVGLPTGGRQGVVFPNVDQAPRHPSQLYEAASHFLLFGILVLAARHRPGWAQGRAGRLTFLFLALYGFFRFATDFYRADEDYLGPFSTGQWASVAVGVIGLRLLWPRGRAARLPKQGTLANAAVLRGKRQGKWPTVGQYAPRTIR